MARIRNIKPEFWTDEDLGRLSRDCRLLFIGLWNQADKAGRLEDRPDRLFARLFPYDRDVNGTVIDGWLQDLANARRINRYDVNGQSFIEIRGFIRHQYLSKHEPESELPGPIPVLAQSDTGTVPIPSSSVPGETGRFDKGQGTVDKGQGTRDTELSDGASDFASLWNQITNRAVPQCREVTAKRRKLIAIRTKERPPEEWQVVFQKIAASRFCRGENDRGWVATIDWALQPDTAAKVLEGKYDNRSGKDSIQPENRAPDPQARRWWEYCNHQPPCGRMGDCLLRRSKETV
jgi:hypothetical protein